MIYYTADLHFGHTPILETANRPFSSIHDMDETLIENWNSTVLPEDIVYVIGDMSRNCGSIPDKYLSRLFGSKHLIRGNHDTGLDDQHRLFDYFESVTDFLEIDDQGVHITLCHYPIVYIQKGYMIHGHLHNTQKDIVQILRRLPRVMNAGVDINNYKPVTLDELIANNQVYYQNPTRGFEQAWREGDNPPHAKAWKADFRPLPTRQ